MSATLIPADRIRAVIDRATTFEDLLAELSELVNENPWVAPLDTFAGLPIGWDGYKAEPPSPGVIFDAKQLLLGINLTPSRVAPSVVGGVGITFKKNGRKAYLELTNAGARSLLLSDGVGDPHAEPVALGDPALAGKIREYLGE